MHLRSALNPHQYIFTLLSKPLQCVVNLLNTPPVHSHLYQPSARGRTNMMAHRSRSATPKRGSRDGDWFAERDPANTPPAAADDDEYGGGGGWGNGGGSWEVEGDCSGSEDGQAAVAAAAASAEAEAGRMPIELALQSSALLCAQTPPRPLPWTLPLLIMPLLLLLLLLLNAVCEACGVSE
jgi:hypothetical protein